MTTNAGLFEEKVYFSSPFAVIFSTKLMGQIVSYFSTRNRPVLLIDMKGLETGERRCCRVWQCQLACILTLRGPTEETRHSLLYWCFCPATTPSGHTLKQHPA